MDIMIRDCPFCGSEAGFHKTEDGKFIVYCLNGNCDISPQTEPHNTAKQALEIWNTRGRGCLNDD